MKPTELEFWYKGYLVCRKSMNIPDAPGNRDWLSAMIGGWSGGIVILDNNKQHTIPANATLAAKRRIVKQLYYGHLLKI